MFAKKYLSFKAPGHFEVVKPLENKEGSRFTRTVVIAKKKVQKNDDAKKKKYNSEWILKTRGKETEIDKDVFFVLAELIYCEMLRLFSPFHPKVRIYPDDEKNLNIASKKISFTSIDHRILFQKLSEYDYEGFGTIQVLALLFNYRDLKPGNYVINENSKNVILIDGDHCLIDAFEITQYGEKLGQEGEFTENDLHSLPLLSGTHYRADNWLDQYYIDDVKTHNTVENSAPSAKPIHNGQFRCEINKTILGILLFSNEMLTTFVDFYIKEFLENYRKYLEPSDSSDEENDTSDDENENENFATFDKDIQTYGDVILNELITRREMMFAAAKKDPLFKEYLASVNFLMVEENFREFCEKLTGFTAVSKCKIFEKISTEYLEERLEELRAQFIPIKRENSNSSTFFSSSDPELEPKIKKQKTEQSVEVKPTEINSPKR